MNKKTSWQNECTLKFKLVTTITVCCWLLGCNQSNQLPLDSNASDATESIIYKISNGKIEIKPRLKYELAISIHVLKSAEDHHRLFIPWAKQMRKNLSEKTFSDATTLIENAHEWQLCSLVQDYDGPDTIEGITAYIEDDNKRIIAKWASNNGHKVANTLRLNPDQFSKWYADFLKRYYEEGFKEQWLSEHKKLVYKDAENIFNELETLDFSAAEFMEDFTGRKFKGNTKIILYPSSFSRPQHAYGFNEEECKVTVYKIGGGKKEVIGSIFHELLHPLIRDWWKANRMK